MKIQLLIISGLCTLLVSPLSFSASQAEDLYKKECSTCHLAYPARLLPQRSWEKIMQNLGHHFGESAELNSTDQRRIAQYLSDHSSDVKGLANARESDDNGEPILRITETARFREEHDDIPQRLIKDTLKLKNLSQCDHCHPGAKDGQFNEDDVKIPGIGRWDD